MKCLRALFIGVFVCALTQAATQKKETLSFTSERIDTPAEFLKNFQLKSHEQDHDFFMSVVALAKIINLGQKLWKIIEDNKPVVDINKSYANAIPSGVSGVEELEKFSDAQHHSYRIKAKNVFGVSVFDLEYTVVHRYGGQYKKQGHYLDAVSVYPNHLSTYSGYTVNYKVDKVSAVNVNTEEDPIASVLLELTFSVKTAMKFYQKTQLFEFKGDNKEIKLLERNK